MPVILFHIVFSSFNEFPFEYFQICLFFHENSLIVFCSILSQFALHHQGIFRISGSQIEINTFREAFEKGNSLLNNGFNQNLNFEFFFSAVLSFLEKLAHWRWFIGEDPLQNVVDATDVNSIAGVLKLYLRELRESLFPIFLFDQLTECAKCSSADEFVKQVCFSLYKCFLRFVSSISVLGIGKCF